jgi:hypothetical protein
MGDKNKLKPAPKHPSSLKGGINTRRREKVKYKEEREGDLSKVCFQQLHAPFSPSSFPTKI